MKKTLTIAMIGLIFLAGLALLPINTAKAATIEHTLISSDKITEDSDRYYINYDNGVFRVRKADAKCELYGADGNYIALNIYPRIDTYTWDSTSVTYDSGNSTFTLSFTNNTNSIDVTVTIIAYTDGVSYEVSITGLSSITSVVGITLNTYSDRSYVIFDYATMGQTTISTDTVLDYPAFGVKYEDYAWYISEIENEYAVFNYLKFGSPGYFGLSTATLGQIYYHSTEYKSAVLPVSSITFTVFFKPAQSTSSLIDNVAIAYPHAYARDATLTFTFDDGLPYTNANMLTNFSKYLNKHNIYMAHYFWWKYRTNESLSAQNEVFYENSTYLNALKNYMKAGNILGLHTPTEWDDPTTNFTDAFADVKYYLSSDALKIHQYHGDNAEIPKNHGVESSSNYYSLKVIADNVEFSGVYYISSEGSVWHRKSIVSPAIYNSSTDDFGKVVYTTRHYVFTGGIYQTTNVSGSGYDATTKEDITDFVHDLLVYHNAIVVYNHLAAKAFMFSDDSSPQPWVYDNGTIHKGVKYLVKLIDENHTKIWTPNPYTFYKYAWVRERIQIDKIGDKIKVYNPTQYDVDGFGIIVPSKYTGATSDGKELPIVQKDGFNVVVFSIDADESKVIELSEKHTFYLLDSEIGEQSINIYKSGDAIYIETTGYGKAKIHLENIFGTNAIIVKDVTTGSTVNWEKGSIIFTAIAGHKYKIFKSLDYAIETGISLVNIYITFFIVMMVLAIVLSFGKSAMNSVTKAVSKI